MLMLMVLAAYLYVLIRLILVAPVVVVDRVRNPVAALRRAWALSRGNTGRIALFLFLVLVVFFIVMAIIMAIIGTVLAVTVGANGARIVAALFSATLGAILTLYLMAILAAIHRQLAGPSPQAMTQTFE